jgi:hypothetical protein
MTALVLLAMIAPTAQTARDSELIQLVPAIVDAAVEAAARKETLPSSSTISPLFVDLTSFAFHGNATMHSSVSRAALSKVLPAYVIDATGSEAIRCSDLECWVMYEALFVRLDSLRWSAFGVEALVTYKFTDRHPSGHVSVGMAQWRFWFGRRDKVWVKTRSALARET